MALPSSLGSDRTGGRQRPTNRYDGSYTRPDILSRKSHPDRPEPPSTDRPQACLVGLGEAPLELHHHGMEVMRKIEDGTWVFYIDHPYGADRSWDIDRPAHQD